MLLGAMLVTGCVQTGANSGCAGWKPIRLADQSIDGMTDQDAAEILAHNAFGRERKCW